MTSTISAFADADPSEPAEPSESAIRSTVTRLYGLIGRDSASGSSRRGADGGLRGRGSRSEDADREATDGSPVENLQNGSDDGVSFDQFVVIDDESPAELGTGLEYKAKVIRELFEDVGNVCLRGPTGGPFDYQLCSHFVDGPSIGGNRVLVTTDQSAADRLRTLSGYGAGPFDEVTVIAVGERSGSGDPALDEGARRLGSSVTVKRVPDPTDLVRLGLLINTQLDVPEEGEPPSICFHHLDDLLARADLEQVFRFLHILQGRVTQAGARAHYHLDPTDASESELSILDQLFDVCITFDEEGGVRVGC